MTITRSPQTEEFSTSTFAEITTSTHTPAVVFRFTTGRGGEHPAAHLAGYEGYLQADGYAGYNTLYRDPKTKAPRGVTEVGCWAHYPEPGFIWCHAILTPGIGGRVGVELVIKS